jgi:glutamine amidotransferase
MIAIIDFGAGNLHSVANAITSLGYRSIITADPGEILDAQTVILPGVGAAADAMASLLKLNVVEAIHQVVQANRPFLAICIGLQILLSFSEEGGRQPCLDIIPGKVTRLPEGIKIPHIGWNQVKQLTHHPVFAGIPDNTNFYFVHSYYAVPADNSTVIGTTDYSTTFCSALAQRKLVATQFHPEKSGKWGLKFFDNFFKMAGEPRGVM